MISHATDKSKGYINKNNPNKPHIQKINRDAYTHHKKRVSEVDVRNEMCRTVNTDEYILKVPRQMITGDQKSANPIDIGKVLKNYEKNTFDQNMFTNIEQYEEKPQLLNTGLLITKRAVDYHEDGKNVFEDIQHIDVETFKSGHEYVNKNSDTIIEEYTERHINQTELNNEGYKTNKEYFTNQFFDNDEITNNTLVEDILEYNIKAKELYPKKDSIYNNIETKDYIKQYFVQPEAKTTKIDSIISFNNSNTETDSKINKESLIINYDNRKIKTKIEDHSSVIDLYSKPKYSIQSNKTNTQKHINNIIPKNIKTREIIHTEFYTKNNTNIKPKSVNHRAQLKYKPSLENKRYFQNKVTIPKN
jgi:hypothetical protein